MENYKSVTKQAYERYAKKFEAATKEYLVKHLLTDAEFFIQNLPGKRILDLGSGPGWHGLFFKESGLDPVCFDISPEMIKLCKKKGLKAELGDIEDLKFKNDSFDGVWAVSSLLHVPKTKIPDVLAKLNKILKPNGLLFVGVKEGKGEELFESEKYPGVKRFFSYFNQEEMRDLLKPYFEVIRESKANPSFGIFLDYMCRKRP